MFPSREDSIQLSRSHTCIKYLVIKSLRVGCFISHRMIGAFFQFANFDSYYCRYLDISYILQFFFHRHRFLNCNLAMLLCFHFSLSLHSSFFLLLLMSNAKISVRFPCRCFFPSIDFMFSKQFAILTIHRNGIAMLRAFFIFSRKKSRTSQINVSYKSYRFELVGDADFHLPIKLPCADAYSISFALVQHLHREINRFDIFQYIFHFFLWCSCFRLPHFFRSLFYLSIELMILLKIMQ